MEKQWEQEYFHETGFGLPKDEPTDDLEELLAEGRGGASSSAAPPPSIPLPTHSTPPNTNPPHPTPTNTNPPATPTHHSPTVLPPAPTATASNHHRTSTRGAGYLRIAL